MRSRKSCSGLAWWAEPARAVPVGEPEGGVERALPGAQSWLVGVTARALAVRVLKVDVVCRLSKGLRLPFVAMVDGVELPLSLYSPLSDSLLQTPRPRLTRTSSPGGPPSSWAAKFRANLRRKVSSPQKRTKTDAAASADTTSTWQIDYLELL